MERGPIAAAASELMHLGKMPTASEVVVGVCNGDELVARVKRRMAEEAEF